MKKIVIALVLILSGCSDVEPERIVLFTGTIFGTSYNVKVVADEKLMQPAVFQQKIDSLLNEIDMEMSTYKKTSVLSQFNVSEPGEWFSVPSRLVSVVEAANRISDLSYGAFDVTVGPLVNLWGFGPNARPDQIPSPDTLQEILNGIGYQHLQYRNNPPALKKTKPLYVDLSAIAKGLAVDEVTKLIELEGFTSYLVEIGGEMRGAGLKPNGKPWVVGIETPVTEGQRTVQKAITLEGSAVATSGDYRNYYEEDGERFSHTIDTRTGYPIKHNLASVTVVAENSMRADALATTLMVLGPEEGLQLANEMDLAVFLIIRRKDEFVEMSTTKFQQMVY